MSDDAGSAAELARLRERAYGPDADIAGDPRAAQRLAELESMGRRAAGSGVGESLLPGTSHSSEAAREQGVGHRRSDSTRADAWSRSIRKRRLVAVTVVALVGIMLAAGVQLRQADEPRIIATLQGDSAAPGFVATGALGEAPNFPVAEDLLFSAPLGTVLGWDVWIARSRSNFACLAITRGDDVKAYCEPSAAFDEHGVVVRLESADIPAEQRPAMADDEVVAYRWLPDRTVSVRVEAAEVVAVDCASCDSSG